MAEETKTEKISLEELMVSTLGDDRCYGEALDR
jgi:hypothetical protein